MVDGRTVQDWRWRPGASGEPRLGASVPPCCLRHAAFCISKGGAGASPQRAGALPFETEFRTGKIEGDFCGPCWSKGLEESRIESGVMSSSPDRGSGRESALTFPKKSEPTDGPVAQSQTHTARLPTPRVAPASRGSFRASRPKLPRARSVRRGSSMGSGFGSSRPRGPRRRDAPCDPRDAGATVGVRRGTGKLYF